MTPLCTNSSYLDQRNFIFRADLPVLGNRNSLNIGERSLIF